MPEEVDNYIDYLVDHEGNYLVVVRLNNWDMYFLHLKNLVLIDTVPSQTVVALDSEDKQGWVTACAMYVGLVGLAH